MTYIRINITINEVRIREEIFKLCDRIKMYIEHHYREAFIRASELGASHGQSAFVAGIHKFLNHYSVDLTGTIACECRRRSCPGYTLSVRTFAKKMKAIQ